MINGFHDKETAKIYDGRRSSKLPGEIQQAARRKLKVLHAAADVTDLRVPPGNRLEALEGRQGYFSIRINRQWRITFRWNDGAEDVKIEEYH